ncbi:hypothetical protein PhCBS80983_g00119 [Powellomyces hirtus]|uniref:Origin recognition complex subunit 2 n=1 Tax=Powellomyces hirtus TaxID=109895 RepID=A0A507EI31_9FUNG|nr:hypothetical protein PhCBS80983_g00119 [Powellomyces hirtus]
MATNGATPRRRRLQTGLTVDYSPRGAKVQDETNILTEDQETLDVITEVNDRRDGDHKEDSCPLTPGKDLYTFAQNKRKRFTNLVKEGRRIMDGMETASPGDAQTPRKRVRMMAPGDAAATPTRTGRRTQEIVDSPSGKVETPTRRRGSAAGTPQGSETPGPIRLARKRKASKRLSSVNEDLSSDDEDELDESEDEAALPFFPKTANEDGEEESGHSDDAEEEVDRYSRDGPSYQRYFANLHDSLSKTSNNTLSKLPPLSPQSLNECLKKIAAKHQNQISLLTSLHQDQFDQWFFELRQGFNLLFYGYGSKRPLLNQFASEILDDGRVLVIHGFFPALTIRSILKKITDEVLQYEGPVGSLLDHLSIIISTLKEPLYLVVHNIDGQALRSTTAQLILTTLASHPTIHLVASVDHINAPLLWDNVQQSRYNWVWHDITTFASYAAETSMEGSLLSGNSGTEGPRLANGVIHVLRALNMNARKMYKILCDHQIKGGDEVEGLSYTAWYQKARENFFVSNEMTFRTQLTEFRDHCIVKGRKGTDGEEIMYVPIEKGVLESILDTFEL